MTLRSTVQQIKRQQDRDATTLARIEARLAFLDQAVAQRLDRQEELLGKILDELTTPEPAGAVTIHVGPVSDIPNL